jgi:hypothetical protein
MFNIIITLDYEIFGNGKGDVEKHILNPAKKIFDITANFNVPISIMFEIYQYIAYKKYNDVIENDLGYSPEKIIKNQIKDAYNKGNDIQLHIHPQFYKMIYKNKRFILKNPKLSVHDLEEENVYELIKTGKEELELLINNPDYRCTTLRLSNMGWIEAPRNTLKPMEKLGIIIHSLSDEYKEENNQGFWKLFDSRVYEIPIFAIEKKIYQLIKARGIFTLFYNWIHSPQFGYPSTSENEREKISPKNKHYRLKWDYSKLSYKEMINFLEKAICKYNYEKYEIPLVMIGHTKDFFNNKNLEKFLEISTKEYVNKGIARFTTFKDFIDRNLIIGE